MCFNFKNSFLFVFPSYSSTKNSLCLHLVAKRKKNNNNNNKNKNPTVQTSRHLDFLNPRDVASFTRGISSAFRASSVYANISICACWASAKSSSAWNGENPVGQSLLSLGSTISVDVIWIAVTFIVNLQMEIDEVFVSKSFQ